MSTSVFPLFLKLSGRQVLVVGGGSVALQKVRAVLLAGAKVHVVAKHACSEIEQLERSGHVTLDCRPFAEADVREAWLVVSATNDPVVNREVAKAAESARVFACAVDDLENGSAFFGSIVERDPFLIAISSRGETPALTRLVREVVEHVLPGPEWVNVARDLRRTWKEEGRPLSDRFPELVQQIGRAVRPGA